MNSIIEQISSAKHIEIVVTKEYMYVASALYTYVLTLHKKVSLVCKDEGLGFEYSFLPWFEKIKKTDTPSADLSIDLNISAVELYFLFKNLKVDINKKMATALYAAILSDTNGLHFSRVDGMTFAIVSELIELKADYKLVHQHVTDYISMGALRLKSKMLEKMLLLNDTKAALFCLCNDELKSTGTSLEDAKELMREAFLLPYVETSVLLNIDDNEVIKIINKEI